jgi:hypothetical protein
VRPAWELRAPINWRPPPAFNFRSEKQSPHRQQLNFDLSLPLQAQLEAARLWLLGEQIKLRRQGRPAPRTLENQRERWAQLIEVLDQADSCHPLWSEAAHMMQQSYREILHLRRNESPS